MSHNLKFCWKWKSTKRVSQRVRESESQKAKKIFGIQDQPTKRENTWIRKGRSSSSAQVNCCFFFGVQVSPRGVLFFCSKWAGGALFFNKRGPPQELIGSRAQDWRPQAQLLNISGVSQCFVCQSKTEHHNSDTAEILRVFGSIAALSIIKSVDRPSAPYLG